VIALLAEGKIKPVVAGRLPLEEIARAHELLEQGQVQGKLVLLPHASQGKSKGPDPIPCHTRQNHAQPLKGRSLSHA
jgi:hypothetical protein